MISRWDNLSEKSSLVLSSGKLNEEGKCNHGTWGFNSNHVIQSSGPVSYELGRFTDSEISVSICECRDLESVEQLSHQRTCEPSRRNSNPKIETLLSEGSPREEMSRKIGKQRSLKKAKSRPLKHVISQNFFRKVSVLEGPQNYLKSEPCLAQGSPPEDRASVFLEPASHLSFWWKGVPTSIPWRTIHHCQYYW